MNRARGVMTTTIPAETFAHIEQTGPKIDQYWLIDRGAGEGARYAIIDVEGVFHAPTTGLFEVLDVFHDRAYVTSVERVVDAVKDGEQRDLADVVRVFGARLESNFWQAHAWATENRGPVLEGGIQIDIKECKHQGHTKSGNPYYKITTTDGQSYLTERDSACNWAIVTGRTGTARILVGNANYVYGFEYIDA